MELQFSAEPPLLTDAPKGIKADASSRVAGLQMANSHTNSMSNRTVEELLTALRKGTDLLKHGRLGKPKMHFFRLAESDSLLTWRSANGKPRGIPLASVKQVVKGQVTEIFKRHPLPYMAHASFSLLYTDLDASSRTLDLTCRTEQEFELWFWGLQAITERSRSTGAAQNMFLGSPTAAVTQSAKSLNQFSVGSQMQSNTVKVLGGGTVQGRVTGALGVPVPEQRPGDCYVWGSFDPNNRLTSAHPAISDRLHCAVPAIVEDSTHLDVSQVAVGLRHAALVTRSGEAYTWGDGASGKLGLGHAVGACSPQRVHMLWGQHIKSIIAGDGCTAAVTEDGALYTWGDGAAGNLGYADALRQFIPRRVEGGLLDHVITQVSCGPYHCAAISSTGAIFTWGDGLCGKLGHGNLNSCIEPRQVEALMDKRVLHVACGVWHTAAVAAEPIGGSSPLPMSKLSYLEGEAILQKLSAAYAMLDEEGGSLYTWGGQFTWVEHTKDSAGHVVDKKDHHRGCLGHGDTAGRLVPTRVGGALRDLAVQQVECGQNLTIVLTVDGRIWQMGETGAPPDKRCTWEGAREPQHVPLPGHFVERIAVGMQHVAALAGPLDRHTGRAEEGEECSVIFMWGRGREGQLGSNVHADSTIPTPVDELRGRHVLQVACGGCYTLAVCTHDADKEDTEERRRGYKGKMRAWFSNNNRPLISVPERVEMHALKLPNDSGSTSLSDERAASVNGSLATSFTPITTSDSSTPRSDRAALNRFAWRRASLAAGARAFSSSLSMQLRRHSGDAYAASQRLLGGAKSQTPTSEQAGPRRVTSPEVKGASATPTAETSTSLPNPLVADLSGSGSQAGAQKQGTAAHVSTDASEGSGKLYIAALENRVAELEALLAQSTRASPSSVSQPLEPLPSPFRSASPDLRVSRSLQPARRHSVSAPSNAAGDAQKGQAAASDGSRHSSSRGPADEEVTVRRMLQLSPQRSQSLSPQRHRRTASPSLADWTALGAPLWQPHEQSPSSISDPPSRPQQPSHQVLQQREQPPASTDVSLAASSAESKLSRHLQEQHQSPAQTAQASSGERRYSSDLRQPRSPVFRTSTIDVGALMGSSPWHLGSQRSPPLRSSSTASHASGDTDGHFTLLGASPVQQSRLRPGDDSLHSSAAEGEQESGSGVGLEEAARMLQRAVAMQRQTELERAELQQMLRQLEAREQQLAARVRELQARHSHSQRPLASEADTSAKPDEGSSSFVAPSIDSVSILQPGAEHTLEVSEGVFLTLEATQMGANALKRIRFARGRFSRAEAETWWRSHKGDVAQRCNLAPGSPRSAPEDPPTPTKLILSEPSTPHHTAPPSPQSAQASPIAQAGDTVSVPHLPPPLSLPPPDLLQTSPAPDSRHQQQQPETPGETMQSTCDEEHARQDQVSWAEGAVQLARQEEGSWPETAVQQPGVMAVPHHSASAYAWCCDEDIMPLSSSSDSSSAPHIGRHDLQPFSPGFASSPHDSGSLTCSSPPVPSGSAAADNDTAMQQPGSADTIWGAGRNVLSAGRGVPGEPTNPTAGHSRGHSRGSSGSLTAADLDAALSQHSCQTSGASALCAQPTLPSSLEMARTITVTAL